jgi:hypothetical protein
MVIITNGSQIGFIDFLVRPLYDAWTGFSRTPVTSECLDNISLNRERWALTQQAGSFKLDDVFKEYVENEDLLDMQETHIVFGAAISPRIKWGF